MAVDVSVVLVNFNTKDLLLSCIRSVQEHIKSTKYEIIAVDNASTDGSLEALKKLKNIKLIVNKENLGFAGANNQGIRAAEGKYVLLLNSDTLISDNVVGEMSKWMDSNRKVGIATCALKNRDNSFQGTGGYFPTLGRVFSWMTIQDIPGVDKLIKPFHPMKNKAIVKGMEFYKKEKELDWVTGAFFFVRKEVFEQVGLLDESYFMYVEEVDFCYRAKKKGWRVWYLPGWSIVHYGGASGTKEMSVLSEYQGIKMFYQKHYPKWQYFFLRVFLKIGAIWRMFLFGFLEGPVSAKIYAKAFKVA